MKQPFLSKKSLANSLAVCASTAVGYWAKDKSHRTVGDHVALGASVLGVGVTALGAAALVLGKIKKVAK